MAGLAAKYTDGIKKWFKALTIEGNDVYAETVIAVNADGSAIGGGGGEVSGEVDVTDRVGRLVGVVSLDAAALSALENTTVLIDAASLAQLESISVQNNVSTDMLDRSGRLVGIVSLDAAALAALESITAVGPLTDTQLRATPVPISGDVSGDLTISGTVATDGLTDTELRATPVPISGNVDVLGAVEIMNDAGNPIPVNGTVTITDGSGPVTVDGTVATTSAILDPLVATEDVALASGHKGIPVFYIRHDADTSLVDADGDAAAPHVDSLGRTKVRNIKDASVAISATLNIANGASLSGTSIDLTAKSLIGISMPAAWTAAGLSFEVSVDAGGTWQPLVDSTNLERTLTVVAAKFITVDPTWFMGAPLLRLRSGTSAAAVNQGASRDFKLTTVSL